MKRLITLGIFFIIFGGELFSDCHKIVIAIDSDITMSVVNNDNYDDEIKEAKKLIEEAENPFSRKRAEELLERLENKSEMLNNKNQKLYKEYHIFRQMLLQKYKNNIGDVVKSMSTSPGVELVQSRRGSMSDYFFYCIYDIDIGRNENTGMFSCDLDDVQTGEIIWVSEWKKIQFKKHRPAEEIFPKAWSHFLTTISKSTELEQIIRKEIDYKNATLEYEYNDKNKKEADGKQKGETRISNIHSGEKVPWTNPKPRNIAEFTLKAKQGTFEKTQKKEIKFIPRDYKKFMSRNYANEAYLELKYKYKTYNCNKASIKDKLFETFTLERSCFLSQDDSTIMAEIKAPFECPEPYYTVTVTQKTTSKVKPLKQYRGISKTLKSFEEDKDVYYIYVDTDKAKIEQYHINKLSTRKIHKEVYKLNTKSCLYEVKVEDEVVKNMGGPSIFNSEDAGWGFEDDTIIYVTPPYSDKQLSFRWGQLRENGSYHASGKYKKEIPKLVKELMGKVNGMATTYRNEAQTDPMIQFAISTTYLSPPDEGCAGRVSMESFIPPLDGFIDPDVEYKIDIRPSTKSEKKVMKAFLNNEVGNPGDYILKALQHVGGGVDGK